MNIKSSTLVTVLVAAAVTGAAVVTGISAIYSSTSRNESCMSCHYHTDADAAWKKCVHYNNPSGTKTDCAACHLPPKGSVKYVFAKARVGIKDLFSYWTKNKEDIDWQSKSELSYARDIVYNESCTECHINLLPEGISDDGITAHLYYEENAAKLDLQCISCHLDVGHYNPGYSHSKMVGVPQSSKAVNGPAYEAPAEVTAFESFTETVPGTHVSISMKAVPGGTFNMGSPDKEYGRGQDEGPRRSITVSPFFMGETEVTWDQYWAFYGETMSEGRIPPEIIYLMNSRPNLSLDAISGPTPPFGSPDQSWGMGDRPAITMTHYAAQTFCRWLSLKTGRTYRLPTEAEWEYAARAGTDGPYFFDGNARKYSRKDTTLINSYIVYKRNSRGRSQEPSAVRANPFGLKNMLGNVQEYCSDWYAPDAYSRLSDGQKDPKGPESGEEHVVRGGIFSSEAPDLRCASRSHTEHDEWIRTDPQNPKSIWWYSDCNSIGFRVVCEVPENIKQ